MDIRELFKRILSVSEYSDTHNILYICGIKLKFPKYEYYIKNKNNPFYYYKKNNIDITSIPPADGQIRDIQLANLALLKELDYVCKENGLKYWIDFGTLLGAVRHKGFIPWDDDIDVGMLREDYDRLIDAFHRTSRNPDIFAEHFRDKKFPSRYYMKIYHKNLPYLFVDIFPYDVLGEVLGNTEGLDLSEKLRKLCTDFEKEAVSVSDSDIQSWLDSKRKIILPRVGSNSEESDVVWGIEYNHAWKNWVFSKSVMFPLKTISFEGVDFLCVNNVEEYLTQVYGDYMAYPKKIGFGHGMFVKIPDEDKEIIEKLVKGE